MFTKEYKVFIPEPCQENWNEMLPIERGRHCNSCSKIVTDFTSMSNEEITRFLKYNTGKVCGRFKTSQLTQTFKYAKPIRIPLPKKVFKYLLGLFMLGGQARIKAQTQDSVAIQVDTSKVLVSGNDSIKNDLQDSLTKTDLLQEDSINTDSLVVESPLVSDLKLETIYISSGFVLGGFTPIYEVISGYIVAEPKYRKTANYSDSANQAKTNIQLPMFDQNSNNNQPNKPQNKQESPWYAVLPDFFRLNRKSDPSDSKKV